MKRILINATQPEEIRVAMVDGQRLYDLDIEHSLRAQKKANIYKGIITRIEPSLEAAFVNYGSQRHGFLSFREVAPEYYHTDAKASNKPNVKDMLREGQEILVQVDKEERGNKGAALTTYLSLAGRYLVLMPNNPKAGGVSRRIEGEDRQQIKQTLNELDVPDNMGVIVRTAGIDREADELAWDLDYLKTLWGAIQQAYQKHKGPVLLYQESNVIIRALRDYFRRDIGEIIIDSEKVYKQARDFMQAVMPQNLRKLKHYTDSTPLFSRFQVENQIETAYQRTVALPSGGAIVIDHTEALVSIDINSARATKGQDIEETALNTNLEAADEIARQLRLRDLGGLIVIDFIDMLPSKHQRDVEKRLRDAMKLDRARVQVGRISRFGLLEMSRQRLRPSLGESSQIVCPRCTGHGHIRSTDSLALSILRLMEEEAMKEMTGKVLAQVPVTVASFLLNEKRQALSDIQTRRSIELAVIPNPYLDTPHYEISRIRNDGLEALEIASYKHIPAPPDLEEVEEQDTQPKPIAIEAAVTNVLPSKPSPQNSRSPIPATAPKGAGLVRRLFNMLFGSSSRVNQAAEAVDAPEKAEATPARPARQERKQPDNSKQRQAESQRQPDNRERNPSQEPTERRDNRERNKAANAPQTNGYKAQERQESGNTNRRDNREHDDNRQTRRQAPPQPSSQERGERQERPERQTRERESNGIDNTANAKPSYREQRPDRGQPRQRHERYEQPAPANADELEPIEIATEAVDWHEEPTALEDNQQPRQRRDRSRRDRRNRDDYRQNRANQSNVNAETQETTPNSAVAAEKLEETLNAVPTVVETSTDSSSQISTVSTVGPVTKTEMLATANSSELLTTDPEKLSAVNTDTSPEVPAILTPVVTITETMVLADTQDITEANATASASVISAESAPAITATAELGTEPEEEQPAIFTNNLAEDKASTSSVHEASAETVAMPTTPFPVENRDQTLATLSPAIAPFQVATDSSVPEEMATDSVPTSAEALEEAIETADRFNEPVAEETESAAEDNDLEAAIATDSPSLNSQQRPPREREYRDRRGRTRRPRGAQDRDRQRPPKSMPVIDHLASIETLEPLVIDLGPEKSSKTERAPRHTDKVNEHQSLAKAEKATNKPDLTPKALEATMVVTAPDSALVETVAEGIMPNPALNLSMSKAPETEAAGVETIPTAIPKAYIHAEPPTEALVPAAKEVAIKATEPEPSLPRELASTAHNTLPPNDIATPIAEPRAEVENAAITPTYFSDNTASKSIKVNHSTPEAIPAQKPQAEKVVSSKPLESMPASEPEASVAITSATSVFTSEATAPADNQAETTIPAEPATPPVKKRPIWMHADPE